jgi:hypothetical protein
LTTLFNNTAITAAAPIDAPARRKEMGWLPLLTMLFCISYGLMTMLIVEQGATIESQRALIRELFRDSTELSTFKLRAQQERVVAGARPAPSPKTQAPTTQNGPSQLPSPQAPAQQTPSSQAETQHQTQKSMEKRKPQFQAPSRPGIDLLDARRALITI